MTHSAKIISQRAIRLLIAATLLGIGLVGIGRPAVAATPPVLAGLTITPSSVAVGTGAQVLATATNTTGGTLNASMGVNVPATFTVSGVSGTGGCHPRNLTRLVYCGVQNLPPGAAATITFTATPAASGSFTFQSYARILQSSENSLATATLTVS
jgi:hypothetical protein